MQKLKPVRMPLRSANILSSWYDSTGHISWISTTKMSLSHECDICSFISLPLAELLQVPAGQTHVHLQGFDPVVQPHKHTLLLAGAVHRSPIQ